MGGCGGAGVSACIFFQAGVTPGPSLGEESDLAQPLIPHGPLPEVDLSKIGNGGSDKQASTNER